MVMQSQNPGALDTSTGDPQKDPARSKFTAGNQVLLKAALIGILILVLLIPSAFFMGLIEERAQRQDEVVREVSEKWGEAQTITGPVLMVPYEIEDQLIEEKKGLRKAQAYFLPSRLVVNGRLLPEVRHRSLYEVSLYRSEIYLEALFDPIDFNGLDIEPSRLLWADAQLLLGLDDLRGLEEEVRLNWNGQEQAIKAGVQANEAIGTGLSTAIAYSPEIPNTISVRLRVRGSGRLYFSPVGNMTNVHIRSGWKNPAFDGKFLPHTNKVTGSGFSANWKVMQASRPFPQAWTGKGPALKDYAFGVRLLQPTDTYRKTERSVKYALLFITLTFSVFFLIETLQRRQIHPLQYLLVGIALIVFYSLLLSFSEYLGFNPAYGLAALATVILIGWYTGTLFKKKKIALGFTLALGALYAYIFFLIQLQDYALLFGSVGLFLIVAVAMYSSRKIDWYNPIDRPGAQPGA